MDWDRDQDVLLRQIFRTRTQSEIVAAFPGRKWRAIRSRAKTLGLRSNSRQELRRIRLLARLRSGVVAARVRTANQIGVAQL